jgi:hypothetical protein
MAPRDARGGEYATAYEKQAETAKAHLMWRMEEAAILDFGDGKCLRRKEVKRKGYVVEDTTYVDARVVNSRRKHERSSRSAEQHGSPFNVVAAPTNAMASVEQSRAIAETQAAMLVAKRFPRDRVAVTDQIQQRLHAPGARRGGGVPVRPRRHGHHGPIDPRGRERWPSAGETCSTACASSRRPAAKARSRPSRGTWKRNTRQVKVFKVPHTRYSRDKGNTRLTDERDIYEMIANQGARRLRACILGVIPATWSRRPCTRPRSRSTRRRRSRRSG